jgi:hypothetical protein
MHSVLYMYEIYLSLCLITICHWRLFCWNVRGLNSESRQRDVRLKIEESDCDIIFYKRTSVKVLTVI